MSRGESLFERPQGTFTSSYLILLSYNEICTVAFPGVVLTCSFRDFIDAPIYMVPHDWVVLHSLTLFLYS